MNDSDERKQSRRIQKALQDMGERIKEKERAYAENDIEAIRRIREHEEKVGAVSLELGHQAALRQKKKHDK